MFDVSELTTAQVARVDSARAAATAYVWGRQDAGEGTKDTGYSVDFGNAYSFRVRKYLTEETHFLPPIKDAFLEWRDTGEIK